MKSGHLLKSSGIVIFCLNVLLNTTPLSFAEEAVFSDVNNGNSHYTAIQFLKQEKMINGYEDGSFKPNKEINRAEALKMLLAAIPMQKPVKNPTIVNFADIKKTDWFYKVVSVAFGNKIVSGYPDKLFHPEKTINKAESLKIVLLEQNTGLPKTVENKPYSDVETTSWFATYAQVSKERGLYLESRSNDGELFPDDKVTRGQFAELIYRIMKSNSGSKFGRATYYADSLSGNGTSSGADYEPTVFTTAHRTLPFGTKILVKNLANNETVEVTINDRGPYATGIELDLSKSAFSEIADPGEGIITVEYKIVSVP